MKQQFGGTIVGFVIGVVVGLGAALAVAVYVTKVPIPFVNKGVSRAPDQDAAEAVKNKDWDPNAPLYGKNPVRPASAAAGGAVDNTGAGAGATPGAATAPLPPAVVGGRTAAVQPPVPPAVSGDPLGDLAKARSSSSGVDPFTYFVQAGAFRTAEDAESQRAKLSLMGVEAKVSEREQSGRTVWRVRVGPFNTKADADKTKEQLDGSGMETALVRVQR
ncbi:SPOR domain-containing protein [Rhodoferax sediminis]|uniref:Sporulation protein n=1 Tax=Rhodoferax sediminis TaxID=2509614 RepID=A0A515D6M8_9BURK|nr:SPOR domain-containing protein [Rhodoferax sediminis]QDL36076.1 sporulation protein [Rhodoferax sediminis]